MDSIRGIGAVAQGQTLADDGWTQIARHYEMPFQVRWQLLKGGVPELSGEMDMQDPRWWLRRAALWALIALGFVLVSFINPQELIQRWIYCLALIIIMVVGTLKGDGYKGRITVVLWAAGAFYIYAVLWLRQDGVITENVVLLIGLVFCGIVLWHGAKL